MVHLHGDAPQPPHHGSHLASTWWPQSQPQGYQADPTLRAWPSRQHGALSSRLCRGATRTPGPPVCTPFVATTPRGCATLDRRAQWTVPSDTSLFVWSLYL